MAPSCLRATLTAGAQLTAESGHELKLQMQPYSKNDALRARTERSHKAWLPTNIQLPNKMILTHPKQETSQKRIDQERKENNPNNAFGVSSARLLGACVSAAGVTQSARCYLSPPPLYAPAPTSPTPPNTITDRSITTAGQRLTTTVTQRKKPIPTPNYSRSSK